MQETQVQSLGWEDPLEKKTVAHSSILTWEKLRTKELAGYGPWGCKRVGHDLVTKQQADTINPQQHALSPTE